MNKINRDNTIDIMKGILIILVVAGHAQIPCHRLIYLFHMGTFFMISGYLFSNKKGSISINNVFFRKTRSLYYPYVICNLICLFCFLVIPEIFDVKLCDNSIIGIGKHIIKILLFRGRCSLSGPTWFIAVLFFVSIAYAILWKILYNITFFNETKKHIVIFIISLLSLFIGYACYTLSFNFYQIGTMFSVFSVFHLGYIVKLFFDKNIKILNKKIINVSVLIISFSILILLLYMSKTEIRLIDNIIVNPLYFYFASLAGWFFCYYSAKFINGFPLIKKIISYIGMNSLYIMAFHFFSFKIVAFMQCCYLNIEIDNISAFPVVDKSG